MKRFTAIVLTALSLIACQSGQSKYWQDMQRFQGATEAALIDALGPPDNQYTVEGVKYLSYSKTSQYTYNNDAPNFGVGTGVYRHGGGIWMDHDFGNSSTQVYRCDVTFRIRKGIVDNIGRRGNDC
jgi:hypothetical protein